MGGQGRVNSKPLITKYMNIQAPYSNIFKLADLVYGCLHVCNKIQDLSIYFRQHFSRETMSFFVYFKELFIYYVILAYYIAKPPLPSWPSFVII